MPEVELTYNVPAIVTVDTETGEIRSVQVDDGSALLSDGDAESTDPHTCAARAIAEDSDVMWPAWEFGF